MERAKPEAMGRPEGRTDDSTALASDAEEVSRLRGEVARLQAELGSARASAEASRRREPGRARRIATVFLVILTSLCVVATTLAVWVNRTIWNEDRFVAIVAPLARDTAVTNAIAVKLTDQAFQALDIESRVQQVLSAIPKLPPSADGIIAGPLASGAKVAVSTQVKSYLASGAFDQLWVEANRRLHAKLVALLNGDYQQLPNVSVNGGEVRLNLVGAVAKVLQRVAQRGVSGLGLDVTIPDIPPNLDSSSAIQSLSSALGVTLPPEFGQVVIMSKEQLTGYQQAAQRLKTLAGVLFLLSCLLIVVTLVVSPTRRKTIMWLGLGITVGLILGGILLRRVEGRVVGSITAPAARAAARDIFTQVSAGLRGAGMLVATVAIIAAIAAYLAGRPRWFMLALARVRTLTASRGSEPSELETWVAHNAGAVRLVGVVVALLVLFLTGINWLPVAIVGVLLAALLWGVAVAERRVREPSLPPVANAP